MYPTDLEAHLESYGGWTDLSGKESDTPALTPARTSISKSIVQGGVVKVQHAESGERFWIEVANYDQESGSIWGLVANELFATDLDKWQPVALHVFSVWDVMLADEGERLSEGEEERVAMVPSDHLPNTPLPEDHKYEGEVSDGEMHGFGTLTEPDGRVYVGEFRNGLRHGHGKQTFGDGQSYVGQFKDGDYHGLATMTLVDGTKRNCEYREGIILSSDGPLDFGTDGFVEFQIGIEAEEGDSPEMVFKWFKRSAELGYAAAQSMIGDYYWNGYFWGGEFVEPDDDEAIKWYRASAEQGHPWGLYELGRCYELGRGVEANKEEAFRYYKKSHEVDEESPALTSLARCYSGGAGVEKNTEKALEILGKAAETGDSEAQWRLGYLYSGVEDFGVTNLQEAVKWYRLAAEQGDEVALSWLATAYQTGEGVEQDHEEAIKLLRTLVEAGDREAVLRLGEGYLMGRGVAQNFDEARKWFVEFWGEDVDLSDCFNWMFEHVDQQDVMDWIQAGIDRGDTNFMGGLAGSYEMGAIDATDEETKTITEKLYRQAAQLGDKLAQENFAEMVLEDLREQGGEFGEKQQEALSYLREAAENGDRGQQFFLANLYLDGIGVEQNKEKAFKLYLSAAKNDRYTGLHSMNALSDCYRDGTGVEKNLEEAGKWAARAKVLGAELDAEIEELLAEESYEDDDTDELDADIETLRAAAEDGDEAAQFELGQRYYFGEGIEEDNDEAAKWFRMSADQGNARAMYLLGQVYDIRGDWQKSFEYYRQSFESDGNADAGAHLGRSYSHGEGVEQDLEKGMSILHKVADTGHAYAQYYLGYCYLDLIEDSNAEEAAKWLELAAEQGEVVAQLFIGQCYQSGDGVEKCFDQAVKWFRAAAEQGNEEAEFEIAWDDGNWEGLEPSEIEERINWIRSGIEEGSTEAMYALAMCYSKGNGLEKDLEEAKRWHAKSEAEESDED